MELAFKIEEMAYEAETIRSLALAVYDAIYNGCDDYKEFNSALHSVFCMAHDHMEHMDALAGEAHALQGVGNRAGIYDDAHRR